MELTACKEGEGGELNCLAVYTGWDDHTVPDHLYNKNEASVQVSAALTGVPNLPNRSTIRLSLSSCQKK